MSMSGDEGAPRMKSHLTLAVKAGGLFAQPFSKLGTSYLLDVELGWVFRALHNHLAVTADAAYTAPKASGTRMDPRLDQSGGSYTWNLEQRELVLGLSVMYRVPMKKLLLYAALGPRVFLLQSKVHGTAGSAPISTSTEQSTKVGLGIPLGIGYHMGPGHLVFEVNTMVSGLSHKTTGSSNTGSLSTALGYRFLF
jgi:hypothetical protein